MLSWSFVHKVLMEIGLPNKIIQVIMTSITIVSMKVLLKGKKDIYFVTHKGLRKGDPIFYFMFFLCMGKPTHLILYEVKKGILECIKAGRNSPKISHLMFTEILLLFVKENVR